jgi:hypothetical protein
LLKTAEKFVVFSPDVPGGGRPHQILTYQLIIHSSEWFTPPLYASASISLPKRNSQNTELNENMKLNNKTSIKGAAGYILLWLLGIPIPVLLLVFLLRGCT